MKRDLINQMQQSEHFSYYCTPVKMATAMFKSDLMYCNLNGSRHSHRLTTMRFRKSDPDFLYRLVFVVTYNYETLKQAYLSIGFPERVILTKQMNGGYIIGDNLMYSRQMYLFACNMFRNFN